MSDRKYLLLCVHIQQQVSNTVAVAILVVIPREEVKQWEKMQVEVVAHEKALWFNRWQKCLKTNQEMSLTKLSLREMPAPASKMEEWESPMKSEETTCKIHMQYRLKRIQCTRYEAVKWLSESAEWEISGYLVLGVTQNSLHGSIGCCLDGLLNGGIRRRLGQTARQVHHWHVSHWHPERHACQLAEGREKQTCESGAFVVNRPDNK